MWRTSVVFILPLIQMGLMGSYVLCGSSGEGSYPAPGFIMFEFGTSAGKTRRRPQQGHSNAEHPAAPKAYRKQARCIENASTLNFQVPFFFLLITPHVPHTLPQVRENPSPPDPKLHAGLRLA